MFFSPAHNVYARKEKKVEDFNNSSFLFCTVFKKFDKIHKNNLKILYFMKHTVPRRSRYLPTKPPLMFFTKV